MIEGSVRVEREVGEEKEGWARERAKIEWLWVAAMEVGGSGRIAEIHEFLAIKLHDPIGASETISRAHRLRSDTREKTHFLYKEALTA
jgi:hypothetical protein